MEANICDLNHLDGDVLLPPRKRLLAGLKKQNSNGKSHIPVISTCSSEFNTRFNNLVSSHSKNASDPSPVDVVEASKSAAAAAKKAAEAARAVAEEKASIAVKAIAAAKSALELVASFPEETATKERSLKKNKLKKHVPVKVLYRKHQSHEKNKTDEELARKLHRYMNSSPRISKNCSSSSDWKNHKHKKPKILDEIEKTRVANGVVLERGPYYSCNGHEMSSKDSVWEELHPFRIDEKASKPKNTDQLEKENGKAEADHVKEKNSEALEDASTTGRKRGRIKLKKLPLSVCTFRDQSNPKEDMKNISSSFTEENSNNPSASNNMALFPKESSADGVRSPEAAPVLKCQDFKVPECLEQNKIVQS